MKKKIRYFVWLFSALRVITCVTLQLRTSVALKDASSSLASPACISHCDILIHVWTSTQLQQGRMGMCVSCGGTWEEKGLYSIFRRQSSHTFTALNTLWQPLQVSVTFSDKLWTSFSLSEFFLKPFRLPLLNHPLIQRKGPENWLSFNAATARTLRLNKVSVAWI